MSSSGEEPIIEVSLKVRMPSNPRSEHLEAVQWVLREIADVAMLRNRIFEDEEEHEDKFRVQLQIETYELPPPPPPLKIPVSDLSGDDVDI